jgi:KDO2-lipid IV(A) lauroyltransferase
MERRGLNVRKWFLRVILPALRRLPPRAATRVVTGIGQTEYRLFRGLRLRFDTAVERGRGYFGTHWSVSDVGRQLAGNHIRWRTRDQLLDDLSDEEVAGLFRVSGLEHFEAAKAQGRGVILLGNHYGAHLMPAHWVVRQGHAIRLYMERPHHISRVLSRDFDSDGPLGQKDLFISRKADPTEAARSIMRAARVLREGIVVFLASDVRWSGPGTVPARFLGQEYTFSATWAALASISGASVVPVFCHMAADGTHDLEFLPWFFVPGGAGTDAKATFAQRSLRQIEERVARHPENSNDYLFWVESEARAVAAGRSRRERTVDARGGGQA